MLRKVKIPIFLAALIAAAFGATPRAGAGEWRPAANFDAGTMVRGCGVYSKADGQFYVLGGRSSDAAGSEYLNPHVYNPGTDSWQTRGATFPDSDVNNMACGLLGTSGGDDHIFAVGGSTAGGASTATNAVREYDPVADTIVVDVADPWPGNAGGTILPGGAATWDNKLYIIGGFNLNVATTSEIWEFDPMAAAGSRWTQKVSLPVGLGYVPAAVIGDRIFIGGGSIYSGGGLVDSTSSFVFDPIANTVNPIAPIPRATAETSAVNAYGRIWVLGGGRVFPNPANEVDMFDEATGSWTAGPPFATARRNSAADTDGLGRVFLVGGYDSTGTPTGSTEVYAPISCAYTSSLATGASIVPGTLDIGNHCDDCVTAVALPFPFTFNQTAYGSIHVSSNGSAQFASTETSWTNYCLPTAGSGEKFFDTVFAYWDDLYTSDAGTGIFTSTSGSAPSRVFNVEWRAKRLGLGTPVNVEVRLHETSNWIDVVYGDSSGWNGASATAGLELGNGLSPGSILQFSCNSPSLSPGRMLTYYPQGPTIEVSRCVAPNTAALTATVPAVTGASYSWTLTGGTIDSGQGTNAVTFTSGPAGTRMSLAVAETGSGTCGGVGWVPLQVDFGDVPSSNPFYSFICSIARDGITAGCGSGNFCAAGSVLRSQMAVFLLIGEHGSDYAPPACTGIFADAACPGAFTNYIEQLYYEGITGGCSTSPLRFCPSNPVSRAAMAVFLLVARHGAGYAPPACSGVFADVACPSPFADWIEELYSEGITGGCNASPLQYCPGNPVSRAGMAVFLASAFNLP